MNNKIYALIGPYASGKSTLINKLIDMGINYVPLFTTRTPTPLDTDKSILQFYSTSAFEQESWIVRTTYKGALYGIKKSDIGAALKNHKISVCTMDINGWNQVRKLLKNSIESVFIMVDYLNLVDRMLLIGHKNTDMKYHLDYAENNGEFNNWKHTNHVIKNTGNIETAFSQLLAIMGLSKPLSRDEISNI